MMRRSGKKQTRHGTKLPVFIPNQKHSKWGLKYRMLWSSLKRKTTTDCSRCQKASGNGMPNLQWQAACSPALWRASLLLPEILNSSASQKSNSKNPEHWRKGHQKKRNSLTSTLSAFAIDYRRARSSTPTNTTVDFVQPLR